MLSLADKGFFVFLQKGRCIRLRLFCPSGQCSFAKNASLGCDTSTMKQAVLAIIIIGVFRNTGWELFQIFLSFYRLSPECSPGYPVLASVLTFAVLPRCAGWRHVSIPFPVDYKLKAVRSGCPARRNRLELLLQFFPSERHCVFSKVSKWAAVFTQVAIFQVVLITLVSGTLCSWKISFLLHQMEQNRSMQGNIFALSELLQRCCWAQ